MSVEEGRVSVRVVGVGALRHQEFLLPQTGPVIYVLLTWVWNRKSRERRDSKLREVERFLLALPFSSFRLIGVDDTH